MPAAARVTDTTDHQGQLQAPGAPTVTIGGLSAALVGPTLHACAFPSTPPHPTSPIAKGSATVTICGCAAVRIGDQATLCGATVMTGAPTVTIGG